MLQAGRISIEGQLNNVTVRIKDQLVLSDRDADQSTKLENVYGKTAEYFYT